MSKKKIYFYVSLAILFLTSWVFWGIGERKDAISEIAKIAIREVGNQLLLFHRDSTSRVLPVKKLERGMYKLSFEKMLSIEPSNLANVVKKNFEKAGLPNSYSVEVVQCIDKEIAYSYLVQKEKEKDIIPCAGRHLPKACYTITIKFLKQKELFFDRQVFVISFILLCLLFLWDYFFGTKKSGGNNETEIAQEHLSIGNLVFYPEQNKLMKQATEILLSKKECELLAILVANVNQVVKRDELTKRVWEDNGVFVGRSLDTYISKLRKKLKEDPNVQLTNVHGVGYKLIVNS